MENRCVSQAVFVQSVRCDGGQGTKLRCTATIAITTAFHFQLPSSHSLQPENDARNHVAETRHAGPSASRRGNSAEAFIFKGEGEDFMEDKRIVSFGQ